MGSDDAPDDERYFRSRYGATAAGLAYLAVGVGLLVSVVTGSTELFVGVLAATLIVTVLSLAVTFRRDGVMTAENAVIAAFVLLSLGVLYALEAFTELPWAVVFGAVLIVGVGVPGVLLRRTDLAS